MLLKERKSDEEDRLNEDVFFYEKQKSYRGVAFCFKYIGSVIESLIGNFYSHRFTEVPFSKINIHQTEKILHETDSIGGVRFFF